MLWVTVCAYVLLMNGRSADFFFNGTLDYKQNREDEMWALMNGREDHLTLVRAGA